ncbi:hypothetical protein KR51_00034580 [Rubidibacter lacunae KORDI 51-2]|uniref:Uncharacterized protein n=1 Tax=Rubidibacter lacunae KORDI 51-2 TaxID=582515 RepID=U5DEZ3_9CHRO|nr:hypothetical protein [Rubidibacter lacunae]ERN40166.1 hypothetical protein KR51_00034580 [Rubidibacter lacunae KORDI 51-2]
MNKAMLTLGHEDGREFAATVARNLQLEVALVAVGGLARVAVATVGRRFGVGSLLLEVVGQFALEGVLDQAGDELFEQPILAEDLLGIGVLLPELVEELAGLGWV